MTQLLQPVLFGRTVIIANITYVDVSIIEYFDITKYLSTMVILFVPMEFGVTIIAKFVQIAVDLFATRTFDSSCSQVAVLAFGEIVL